MSATTKTLLWLALPISLPVLHRLGPECETISAICGGITCLWVLWTALLFLKWMILDLL